MNKQNNSVLPCKKSDIVTLALGAAVILAMTTGTDRDHRPPLGSRSAIVLIASKPGRKLGESIPGRADARPQPPQNQVNLKEKSMPSHSGMRIALAISCDPDCRDRAECDFLAQASRR